MASGAAFPDANGKIKVIKGPTPGSSLSLKGMRRDTKTVILHTRLATQGSPQDNTNNHPVMSPTGDIALVHNGVIWNDYTLRAGVLRGYELPVVDSSVIPALIEIEGTDGTAHLGGDAAVAWLDNSEVDTLNLARIESSPVAYTNLLDGSFVFASTPALLMSALMDAELEHGQVFTMSELDYYQLRGGVIMKYDELPKSNYYHQSYSGMGRLRDMTSGGHGTSTSTFREISPSEEEAMEALNAKFTEEDQANIDEAWEAMMTTGIGGGSAGVTDIPDEDSWELGPRFFTIDSDGDCQTYDTLDELETALLYAAGLEDRDASFGEGATLWVNKFADLGSFGFDGETMISWLDEPSEIRYHDGDSNDGLGYIRDGVSILSTMSGR